MLNLFSSFSNYFSISVLPFSKLLIKSVHYILCPFFSTHSLLVKFLLSPFYQFLIGIQEPPHCPVVHSVFVLAEHIAVLDIVHHCISLDILPSLGFQDRTWSWFFFYSLFHITFLFTLPFQSSLLMSVPDPFPDSLFSLYLHHLLVIH